MAKVLFDPKLVPMMGMRSAVDPIMTGDGEWLNLANFLWKRGKVMARYGNDLVGTARPFTGAIFRGCSGWLWIDGNYRCYYAFEETGVGVGIYSLNPTSYAWTTIAANNSGNAFTVGYHVQFAMMHDPGYSSGTGADLLVCGNGYDLCRVISNATTIDIAADIAWTAGFNPTSQHMPYCWMNIMNSGNTSYPTAATGAFSGTPPVDSTAGTDDNEIVVVMSTTATGSFDMACSSSSRIDDQYTLATGANEFDLYNANDGTFPYVGILMEDDLSDPVAQYLDIELRDGTTYRYIWEAGSNNPKPVYLDAGDGCYLAVFDLSPYIANIQSYINIDRMRWTMDHALPAARTVRIIGIYGMGNIPTGAKHVVAIKKIGSFVESLGRAVTKTAGPPVAQVGGNKNRNITLPEGAIGQNVQWVYMVRHPILSEAYRIHFYRKDETAAGADDNYYCLPQYAAGAVSYPAYGAFLDTTPETGKYYKRKAPSAQNVAPPKGGALCASGRRMFIGRILNDNGSYWVSDKDYPLRFLGTIRDNNYDGEVDEDSGSVGEMPGEVIQRMVPMPNVYGGFAPIACFTNAALWAIEGPDPLSLAVPGRLNPHGTLYPWTVCPHQQSIFYLDAEKQPRAYVGGRNSVALSMAHIEDQFESGDCWDASGVIFNERYYIDIRAASATKKRLRVYYDLTLKRWFTHTYTTPDLAFVTVQQTLGTTAGSFSTAHGSKQIAVTQDGYVHQLEKDGQLNDEKNDGTSESITIAMSKYVHGGDGWSNWDFGEPGIIWEESTNGLLTATFDTPQDTTEGGALATGTVDMDSNVPDEVWRYFLDSTENNMPGVNSYGTKITITGNPTPGKALRHIHLNIYERSGGGGADAG